MDMYKSIERSLLMQQNCINDLLRLKISFVSLETPQLSMKMCPVPTDIPYTRSIRKSGSLSTVQIPFK